MPACAAAFLPGRLPNSKPPAPAEAANVMKPLRVYLVPLCARVVSTWVPPGGRLGDPSPSTAAVPGLVTSEKLPLAMCAPLLPSCEGGVLHRDIRISLTPPPFGSP